MADINLAGFNFDPSKFQKVFGAGTLNYPLNLQPAVDPYAALHSKYRPLIEQRNKDLQQTSSQDKTGFGLALAAMNDPVTLMLQAELQKINAQNANEMSRENLKLAEEAAIRKQQRDFTLGQLSKTLESIPNAFSPIPLKKGKML